MPTFTEANFFRGYAPTVAADEYTVEANTTAVISSITVTCKTTASTITIKLDGIELIAGTAMSPGDVLSWTGYEVLATGKKVNVQGSNANCLAVHINGKKIT